MQPSKITVVGAGSWGTVVAALLAGAFRPSGADGKTAPERLPAMLAPDRPEVVLVPRSERAAAQIRQQGCNSRYLPSFDLPGALRVQAALEEALEGASLVVMAVPSQWARRSMEAAAPHVPAGTVVLNLAKGLEPETLATLSQVTAEVMPGAVPATLSGPNFAQEIAQGLPAATVVACRDSAAAASLQALLSSERLRVYTNDDVVGCEIAGAMKNVLALAAGMVDGLHGGDNARAAMMTRGLAEMARVGVAMGGHPLTFSGLAGVGDLVLTCTSEHSRNRCVGVALGQGEALGDILASMHQVAEGVSTAAPVVALAGRLGLEVPICEQVAAVLAGTSTPSQALGSLLGREPTHELAGAPLWPGWPGAPG